MLDVVHLATRHRLRREATMCDAVKRDDSKTVRYLLSTGQRDASSALKLAIRDNKFRAFRALLDAGVEIETDGHGSEYLFLAMKHNRPNMIEALIEHGAVPLHSDANLVDQMAVACRIDDVIALKRILCVDPEIANQRLWIGPAITEACAAGSVKCTDELLSHVRDVNARDVLGYTALLYALSKRMSLTKMLRRGTDANLKVEGHSPLWYAIHAKSVDACCELMQFGAVPSRTELDYAIKIGMPVSVVRTMIGNEVFGKHRVPTQCVRSFAFSDRVSAWLWSRCADGPRNAFSEQRDISEIDARVWISDSVMFLNALSHDDPFLSQALPGIEYAIMACAYIDHLQNALTPHTFRLVWLAAITLSFMMWDGYDVDFDVMTTMRNFAYHFGGFRMDLKTLVAKLFSLLNFRAWIQPDEYEKYRLKFD